MACILLWSSAVRVHDSQAYRKMDVTRERISHILELREILLWFQTGFSLVNAAVCAILESISGLEPSSVITDPGTLDRQSCASSPRFCIPPDMHSADKIKLYYNLYGRVSSSSGLAKTILQGTVKGGRRQGRWGRRSGKTTSGNGQAWSLTSPRGQWRKGENGGNWLWNYLWCPSDPRG